MFKHLLKDKNLVCLGLYRSVNGDTAKGELPEGIVGGAPPGYIFTAPPMTDKLQWQDKLICMMPAPLSKAQQDSLAPG